MLVDKFTSCNFINSAVHYATRNKHLCCNDCRICILMHLVGTSFLFIFFFSLSNILATLTNKRR